MFSWLQKTVFLTAVIVSANAFTAVSEKHHFVKSDISYEDGTESFKNPARGNAGGGWVTFKPEGLPNWRGVDRYASSLWELSRFSGGREQNGKRPPDARVGGEDIPITEAMKKDVRRFLDETRAKGGSLIVRLGYTWSEHSGCEPEDFDILLGHIRDLSKIMAEYDDVVVAVEAGIAGPWGEMHSSDYCKAEYMNRILKEYCDNLPESISVLVRAPDYVNKMSGTKTLETLKKLPFTDKYLKRLGMYNDGYLGTWWDYGTWAGDFKRERGVEMLKTFENHPYGGEMAYIGRDWLEKNMGLFQLEKWNIVKEWYDTHLNYLRNIGEKGHTLANFLTNDLVFDSKKYAFDGMPNLAEYDGQTMNKFVRDHMGYRFVVRDARLPAKSGGGNEDVIALEIENTGFGKLLLPSRFEVIARGSSAEAFSAAECSLDIPAGAKKRVALKFKTPLVPESGKYDIYLRASCPFKDEKFGAVPRRPIRFANKGMWDESLRANKLGSFEIRMTETAMRKAREEAKKRAEEVAAENAAEEAKKKAESEAVSDKGSYFTDEKPLVIDMKGGERSVESWHQHKWNGQPLTVKNGKLTFTKSVGVHGGKINVEKGSALAFARGVTLGTGLGDAGTRVFNVAPGARLEMNGIKWNMDHSRVLIPQGAYWMADLTRFTLQGGMKDNLWEIGGEAVFPHGIAVAEAKWGCQLAVRLKSGGVLAIGNNVSTNGITKGKLDIVLEGGKLQLFWNAKIEPGIIRVAPGATVEVLVAKDVEFDPSVISVPANSKLKIRRNAPEPENLPARYTFTVRYDRTGRSYWISADDFKESVAELVFRYPNPDSESEIKTEKIRTKDTLFRKRFPNSKAKRFTVTAGVKDIYGNTYVTNIVVKRPWPIVRQPTENHNILVGHTGYGEALDLTRDIFEKDLCNLYVGWHSASKTHPDKWPEADREKWKNLIKERKMWSMSIYGGDGQDLQNKLRHAYQGRYLGNNIGEYASFIYQSRKECGIPMDLDLVQAKNAFVNRYCGKAAFGWQSNFPHMFSTCGAALSCYELQGGIDFICNEQWAIGAMNIGHTTGEARGAARKWGPEYWCAWNAHEWQTCALPYRTQQKYDSCLVGFLQEYVAGTSMIVLESGAQGKQAWQYTSDTPGQPKEERAKEGYDGYVANHYRDVVKKFYDWVKANPRDKGTPETKIAMALGNLDSYLGREGGYAVWSQHLNADTNKLWKYGAPEETQALLKNLFYPVPSDAVAPFGNHWIGGTPYGQVDVMQVDDESTIADLRRYDLLVFGGWNTMMRLEKDVLERYVREGGTLVMSRPQMTTRIDRDYKNYIDKDLMPLFDFLPPVGKPGDYVEKKFGKGRYILFTGKEFPAASKEGKAAFLKLVSSLAAEVNQTVRISSAAGEDVKYIAYGVYQKKIYFLNADTIKERTFTYEIGGKKTELTLKPCEIKVVKR